MELLPRVMESRPVSIRENRERALKRTLFRVMKMQAVNEERLRWQEVRSNSNLHPPGPRSWELWLVRDPILGLSLADVKSRPIHDTGACHVVFYSCMNTTVLCWHQTRWSKTKSGWNRWYRYTLIINRQSRKVFSCLVMDYKVPIISCLLQLLRPGVSCALGCGLIWQFMARIWILISISDPQFPG